MTGEPSTSPILKTAVVQDSPVLFDGPATLSKALQLIERAAASGAKLIVFPESFIPAYPRGLSFGFMVGSRSESGRRDWQRFYENAVEVPGAATEILGEAAREAGA